jgi:hypothetical protein
MTQAATWQDMTFYKTRSLSNGAADRSGETRDRGLSRLFSRRDEPPGLTAEQAKALFFEQWDKLQSLCHRRFPNDQALADEGLDYIVHKLQQNEWERLRTWAGEGRFSTYLLTLGARLLTDFTRSRYGHIRMPAWLKAQTDPIWPQAYRLIVVQGFGRRDAVNWLAINDPRRPGAFIERVVSEIELRCSRPDRVCDQTVALDDAPEPGVTATAPETLLGVSEDEVMDTLRRYLDPDDDHSPPTQRVAALVQRLQVHLDLSEQDRLLLRLRHYDGLKMTEIVRLLGLCDDPYRRYHRIIAAVREALRRSGLLDVATGSAAN